MHASSVFPAFPDLGSASHKLCSECQLDTSSSWRRWGRKGFVKGQADHKPPFFCFSSDTGQFNKRRKHLSSLKTEVNEVNFINKGKKIPLFGCLNVGFPEY